jgi:hypothetical protein
MILLNIIKAKAKLWVTVGAKFLSYVIPGVRRVVPLYALSIFLSKLFSLTNEKMTTVFLMDTILYLTLKNKEL